MSRARIKEREARARTKQPHPRTEGYDFVEPPKLAGKMKPMTPRATLDELRTRLKHVHHRLDALYSSRPSVTLSSAPDQPTKHPRRRSARIQQLRARVEDTDHGVEARSKIEQVKPLATVRTLSKTQARKRRGNIKYIRAEVEHVRTDLKALRARKRYVKLSSRVRALPQELIDMIEEYTFEYDGAERHTFFRYDGAPTYTASAIVGRAQLKKHLNLLQVDRRIRTKYAWEYYGLGDFMVVGLRPIVRWMGSLPSAHLRMLLLNKSLECVTWLEPPEPIHHDSPCGILEPIDPVYPVPGSELPECSCLYHGMEDAKFRTEERQKDVRKRFKEVVGELVRDGPGWRKETLLLFVKLSFESHAACERLCGHPLPLSDDI